MKNVTFARLRSHSPGTEYYKRYFALHPEIFFTARSGTPNRRRIDWTIPKAKKRKKRFINYPKKCIRNISRPKPEQNKFSQPQLIFSLNLIVRSAGAVGLHVTC